MAVCSWQLTRRVPRRGHLIEQRLTVFSHRIPTTALSAVDSETQRGLDTLKRLYFVIFAGIGVFSTFISVYYREIGLSGVQIGLLNTVGPLVGMFSAALWGMLNDRFGKTRLLLAVSCLGALLAALGLGGAQQFAYLLPIVCVYSLFGSTLLPLIDGTTMSLLGNRREVYGSLRVFGTVGFILTTAVIGWVLERTGLRSMFTIYAGFLAVLLVASLRLPDRRIAMRGSLLSGLGQMVRHPPWLFFTGAVLLVGIAGGGMSAFLGVSLKALGASEGLIGFSWAVAATSEVPAMLFGSRLLRRFGAPRLLTIAFVFYALRMYGYGAIPSAPWVLAVSLIQGPSFGLYWVSAVTYATELTPADLRTTSQGLLSATISLASVIGAAMSGWLFDYVGSRGLFTVLAGCCCLALLLFVTGRVVQARQQAAV